MGASPIEVEYIYILQSFLLKKQLLRHTGFFQSLFKGVPVFASKITIRPSVPILGVTNIRIKERVPNDELGLEFSSCLPV